MKNKSILFLSLFLLLSVLSLSQVQAGDDLVLKWSLCNALNQTGFECDVWWNSFKTSLGIEEIVSNKSFDDYYNKTELENVLINISEVEQKIDEKLSNFTLNVSSDVNMSLIGDLIDDKVGKLRDSVGKNYVEKDDFRAGEYKNNSSGGGGINVAWIVLIVFIMGVGGYLFSKQKTEKNNSRNKGIAPQRNRRIQTRVELEEQDTISKLKKELELEKKKKKVKKKKSKKEVEEEDDDDDEDDYDEEDDEE